MEKNFLQMSFRLPNLTDMKGLCHVRSAGHYIVHPGFKGLSMHKDFLQVFWGVSGSGNIIYNKRSIPLRAGETFCYFPGDYHDIYAGTSTWEYYWITFDGESLDTLARCFGLSHTSRHSGPCPVKLFEDVIVSLLKIDLESAIQSSVRGYEILERVINPIPESSHDIASSFRKIVEEKFGQAHFSIDGAARELGLHRSSLHRIFLAESGISPQEYLLSYRIQQAVNLLLTDMTVKAVAATCGFSCTNYFTKVFRSRIGKPPAAFRHDVSPASGI